MENGGLIEDDMIGMKKKGTGKSEEVQVWRGDSKEKEADRRRGKRKKMERPKNLTCSRSNSMLGSFKDCFRQPVLYVSYQKRFHKNIV